MPRLQYPSGSEWRRWDLQVHTPFSVLNNGFGADFDAYAETLFRQALEKGISAIGITDYFCIEGYKQLKAFVDDRERMERVLGVGRAEDARRILLIPNIELRTTTVIQRRDGSDSRVNFHVIFSEDLAVTTIDEHFLHEIKFTAESNPGRPDESWSLTLDNLSALGQRLKRHHEPFQGANDLYIGMTQAVVSHEDVTAVLERQPSRFKDQFLVVVPADEDLSSCNWNGQGHQVRKLLIQKSHMLFSSNTSTREFGLGRKHSSPQSFIDEFKSLKPCIHGSDAHSYEALFVPAQGRNLWIKANPTFQGLQHLLHEPEGRVYIGDEPPSLTRVTQNATKYMTSISFERTPHAKQGELWFSDTVPLNSGLVAIIGNKGSGKSALADILALLGNTQSSEFSFLNKERFLAPKTALGRMFRARVRWCSGLEVSRLLSDGVDETSPELVKYIPQNYLESICSELKEPRESRFDRELTEVIFSHVKDADRLGKETLSELIAYITDEKEECVSQLTTELAKVNAEIVALEGQLTDEHRKSLESQLEQRRAELKAHEEAKPVEVNEPTQDREQQLAIEGVKQKLAMLVEQTQTLDKRVADEQAALQQATLQIAAADKLLARIANLQKQATIFYREAAQDAGVLGFEARTLVQVHVDRQPVSEARMKADERSKAIRDLLDAELPNSLASQRRELSVKTEAARSRLDEPNRRYQEYLHQLANWKKRRDAIDGSEGNAQSVKGVEAKLAALKDVPDEIIDRRKKRADLVREIFRAKGELLEDYRRLYSPVQTFIDRHPVSQRQGALEFSASITVHGFADTFLAMIHQGRRGSFQGEQEGRERLNELTAAADFSTEAGLETFLLCVQEHLEQDKRDKGNAPARLRDQLRQGKTPEDVFNFLYGLSYLKPRYELRWQGKPLDQLSPGERGNLLLVFYLLIDKRDIPLILDQPEENLDNQTIATMLVPAIKYAKERRQIIMVTHNANLAVVCDADQVIHARLNKANGNRITYTAGGIEDTTITQLIVDVLEGTKPAFDLRDAKYGILDRSS